MSRQPYPCRREERGNRDAPHDAPGRHRARGRDGVEGADERHSLAALRLAAADVPDRERWDVDAGQRLPEKSVRIMFQAMFAKPRCRFCRSTWSPAEGVDVRRTHCPSCRAARAALAGTALDLRPLDRSTDAGGGYVLGGRFPLGLD